MSTKLTSFTKNMFLSSRSSKLLLRTVGRTFGETKSFPLKSSYKSFTPTQQFLIPFSTTSKDDDDSGSHSDFASKRNVAVDSDQEALKIIKNQVENHPVMLYMKGNPSMPMCGFSGTMVKILKEEGIDFSSVNVLDYPTIREGVKKYSEWPTIPQLYVNGEFIGGSDIVNSMHESGELKEVLGELNKE